MQFTKLFNSILDSTIWQESAETKIVWITMLAMCDRYGDVFASIPGLASRSGVTLSQCECAVICFLSPDKYSRTKEHEGKRIKEIDGGWNLLNHGKYRELLSVEERREYNRRKQAEYRASKKQPVNDMSNNVKDCQSKSTMSTYTEAEAEAEVEAEKKKEKIPPNPQGGILPSGWQKLSKTEQGRKKVNFNTPLMVRIGKFFAQKETTLWTVAEYIALQDVNPPEDEIELIEDHYSLEIERNGFRNTALITLLNNWSAARNRAAAYFQEFPDHRNA